MCCSSVGDFNWGKLVFVDMGSGEDFQPESHDREDYGLDKAVCNFGCEVLEEGD